MKKFILIAICAFTLTVCQAQQGPAKTSAKPAATATSDPADKPAKAEQTDAKKDDKGCADKKDKACGEKKGKSCCSHEKQDSKK